MLTNQDLEPYYEARSNLDVKMRTRAGDAIVNIAEAYAHAWLSVLRAFFIIDMGKCR